MSLTLMVFHSGLCSRGAFDESHLTAHCYSERGWLSIDCFTCGSTDPESIIDNINDKLMAQSSELKIMKRKPRAVLSMGETMSIREFVDTHFHHFNSVR